MTTLHVYSDNRRLRSNNERFENIISKVRLNLNKKGQVVVANHRNVCGADFRVTYSWLHRFITRISLSYVK